MSEAVGASQGTEGMMRQLILVVVVALGLQGCAELVLYERYQYHKKVKAGTAPSREVTWACEQEGLSRGPDGDWVRDQATVQACMAKHGWEYDGLQWVRAK